MQITDIVIEMPDKTICVFVYKDKSVVWILIYESGTGSKVGSG